MTEQDMAPDDALAARPASAEPASVETGVTEELRLETRDAGALAKRRTSRGWLLRGLGWLLLGVVLGGGLWSQWPEAWRWPVARRPLRPVESAGKNDRPTGPAKSSLAHGTGESGAEAKSMISPQKTDELARSTVLVQTDGDAGARPIGTGMVISRDGLVATCLHVARNAVQASVRFRDGAVYEVAGYAAVAPEHDLALLQLKHWPPDLKPVAWSEAVLAPLEPVVALGHPQGVEFAPFDGKVSLVVQTSQLPAGVRRFVRELTETENDLAWIQHTARLSDGNSGGPLADAQGRVIGMNVWVDRATGFSYALPAPLVRELSQRTSEPPEPLERRAAPEARLAANVASASAERLGQLALQLRQQQWKARDRGDYLLWQRLAWALALANESDRLGVTGLSTEQLLPLQRRADRIVSELRAARWDDIGQITLLNEFAVEELDRPLAGVVFFGSVERVVTGALGERAAVVRVAGFERRTLVPLTGTLDATAPGDQALFVGVNDRGQSYRYGENPLQPIIAPRIVAPVIIPLRRK